MDSFRKYIYQQTYRELSRLGDRLAKTDKAIDWEAFRPIKTIDYTVQEPEKLLREIGLDYALTTYRAEAITQGYLFPSRTDIYIKLGEEDTWGKALTGRGLKGKGNLRLLIDEEHVFYASRPVNGIRVVSQPQLIVDLLLEGGVCVEAAEMLLEKAVKEAVPLR